MFRIPGTDGGERFVRQCKVTATWPREFAFNDEVEQPIQVGLRVACESDLERHLRSVGVFLRAASIFNCRPRNMTSAST